MDRLIFTALSGMASSMMRERIIASNLANAQTIGFRAETMDTTPVTLAGPSLEARAMSATQVRGPDMKAGPLVQTGRDLDIALEGDALLAVQADDGGEAYTRRGDLSVGPSGVLENGDGRPVLGDAGPVTVPPGVRVTISSDGAVLAADPATPEAAPTRVAQLKLASWRGSRIEKDLSGLFRVPGDGALPTDANARVTPGALEQSNVAPTQALVEMIAAQRLFEIRAKLVSTARDIDESGASLMRLNS